MTASPVPPRPQQKSNNVIWWVLGIVGACIVLVMIAGLLIVSAVLHKVHVNTANNKVEIETPLGNLKAGQDSMHATGLPVYPGATAEKSAGANFEVSANGKAAGLAIEQYSSSDSRDTVQAWYAKRLGPEFKMKVGTPDEKDRIPGVPVNVNSNDVSFEDERPDGVRVVALGRKGESTEITLVLAGKKEAQ